MGQAESTAAGGSGSLHDPALPANTVAFHVLRVAENSPAAHAGLDPFFDFIVGINGTHLGEDIDRFTQVLEHNQGRQVALMVYSTKRKEIRDVHVVPSSEWSSNGVQATVDDQPSLLGLSLRLCNPQHALEQVWHVLEVLEGSPAQSAGLVPFGDWIIGYSGGVLRGEGDFYDVVESHTDRPLRLFVYNSDYDVTREAILVPNRTWGGEGLLGAGVGYGLLHRIPKPQDRPRAIDPSEPSSQSLRSPPRAPTGGGSLVSPPPRSTAPPAPASHVPAATAPPPPRRTAAVSPPPAVRTNKYIPPPPVTSPTRFQPPPNPMSPTSPSRQLPVRSPPPPRQQQQQSTAISFGEYDASEGVEIVPSRNDDDDDEGDHEDGNGSHYGYHTNDGRGQGQVSSPPPTSRYGGNSRASYGGGGGGGSPYRAQRVTSNAYSIQEE